MERYTGTKAANFTIDPATQTLNVPGSAYVAFNKTLDLNTICSSNAHGATLTFARPSTSSLPAGTTFNETTGIVTAGNKTGSFSVTVDSAAVTNYNAALQRTITVNIVATPAASVTAAPTAKTGLKYNGNDQALVSKGTANGGTMQYSLNNSTWSNEIPKGKDAGNYTVYYKVKGDSDHTDFTPTSNTVSVSIAQKEVTVAPGTYKVSKEYDTTTTAGTGKGDLSVTGIVDSGVSVTATPVAYTSANVGGQSNVDVNLALSGTGSANYKLAASTISVPCSITPATLTVTPEANQSKKFKEADPALTYTYSGNASGQTPAFNGKLGREAGENVGTYAIKLGDLALKDSGAFKASNYTLKMVSPAVKFEIKKADAPAAPTELKGYKDNALSTVTLPTGWSWVDGTLKMNTIGDQTFKASYAGDTNHEAGTDVDVTVKVVQKSSGGYYYAPTAAVVPDMPMLYRGCTGDAVKTLQDKLNALGYNSGNVDGIFGAKTYAAVTAFQKANSLGVDGIVGKLTWGKLYGVSPAMPVETTTVVGRPTVSYGSRGDAVRKLQELLNALGYDCGSVDGIFGSKTKAAVLAFQKANGLGADGIVGPLTWAKLG